MIDVEADDLVEETAYSIRNDEAPTETMNFLVIFLSLIVKDHLFIYGSLSSIDPPYWTLDFKRTYA